MPDRGIVLGIVFVFTVALVVMLIELFLPLSYKIEMDIECRKSLLAMEMEGRLQDSEKQSLKERLAKLGFTNITIYASENARQGQELRLRVEADYKYSKLTAFLTREEKVQRMIYDKTAVSRRLVN